MKKIFVLLLFLFGAPITAQAFHFGPAVPAVDHGQVAVGGGYFFYQAELEDVDIEQNRAYIHLGYGLGMTSEPRWEVFVRGGASDMQDDDDFDSDFKPFAAVGVKGAYYDGERFAWGMVVQGAWFSGFESGDIEIDRFREVEIGFPFQTSFGPLILYLGPQAYYADADLEGNNVSRELREDGAIGGFGGLGLDLGPLRLEAEAQYRSDFSAGGFVCYQF